MDRRTPVERGGTCGALLEYLKHSFLSWLKMMNHYTIRDKMLNWGISVSHICLIYNSHKMRLDSTYYFSVISPVACDNNQQWDTVYPLTERGLVTWWIWSIPADQVTSVNLNFLSGRRRFTFSSDACKSLLIHRNHFWLHANFRLLLNNIMRDQIACFRFSNHALSSFDSGSLERRPHGSSLSHWSSSSVLLSPSSTLLSF